MTARTGRSGTAPTRARRPRHTSSGQAAGGPRSPRHTSSGRAGGNSGRLRHIRRLLLAILLLTSVCIAGSPIASIDLAKGDMSIEIVRCHFDEGRIVVRLGDNLHVLRKGDRIDVVGLRLVEVTSHGATISIRHGPPNDGLRLIRITDSGTGALLLREFATDPEALSGSRHGSPAAAIAGIDPSPRGPGED